MPEPSLYDRIARVTPDIERVPVWKVLNVTWLWLEGFRQWADLKDELGLTDAQFSQLQELYTKLMDDAGDDPLALAVPAGAARTTMQRHIAWHNSWQLMLAIEAQRLTKSEVSTYLGVPVP